MSAAKLRGSLQKSFGAHLTARRLLELPTPRAIAAEMTSQLRRRFPDAAAAADADGGGANGGGGAGGGSGAAGGGVGGAAARREDRGSGGGAPARGAGARRAPRRRRALAAGGGCRGGAEAEEEARRRRLVPVLRAISVAWAYKSGDVAVAAAACGALASARGDGHADAPLLAARHALLCAKSGDAAAARAAAARAARAPPHRHSAEGDELHCAERVARGLMGAAAAAARLTEAAAARAAPRTLLSLSLCRLGLTELPAEVGSLKALQRLDASHNALRALPGAALAPLRHLQELDASANDLTDLPAELASLPQLFVLALQCNRFAAPPPTALACRRLRELKIGAQKRGPPSTAESDGEDHGGGNGGGEQRSAQLVLLEMEANGAAALPPLNARNAYLGAVLASFNRIPALPPQLAAHGASLKKLHLGCNRIASLDGAVLGALGRLSELCVEGNLLRELPDEIGSLAKLRELWVHGNALAALPDALGRCASLTVIQCHHNVLRELPDALARLSQLQGLYLQHNELGGSLTELRARIFDRLPLQNLALGANRFDLAEAFALPDARVGLGWNRGVPPAELPALTDRFAAADALFEPACAGVRGELLLVAFSAQGPGMQQWHAPAAALRAAGVTLDVLYVADPSNSFYLQDPGGGWDGVRHFGAIVRPHAAQYEGRVLMVGSSMGATACLQHADLATRALAFAPRVDLDLSHGAFVPPPARAAGLAAIHRSLAALPARTVAVHCGGGNYVDVAQVAVVRDAPSVAVVEHETYHHNVPQFLEGEGELVPLLRSEVARLLLHGAERHDR